jgi:outer membrane receptor protein involved in Fe transport
LLWSGGVKYNALEWLSLYANAGSSFLAPSAKSVGGTLKSSDLGVPGRNGQLPNPGLQPEDGLGYDAGFDIRPLQNLWGGIRFFYNTVDNAIVENVVSQNPSQSKSVNAGNSTSYGIEAEVKHKFAKYVQWFANFTYTDTKIQNSVDPDQDGANIPFVPEYVANVGLGFNLPWDLNIFPYLHMVGKYWDSSSKSNRRQFGPYEVVDLHAQLGLLKTPQWRLNLIVDLHNLFDRKFEMPWQFQDPGFSAMGWIELQL